MMNERLQQFYEASKIETAERRELTSLSELERIIGAQKSGPSLADAVNENDDVAVIAEYKRKSPDIGADIRNPASVYWTAQQYRAGGAAAVSVLTELKHFGGSVSDLADARAASGLPVLSKGFVSDEHQLYEAKAYGASAVLLIAGGLKQERLRRLSEEASDIGLETMVEVHGRDELERAMVELDTDLLGINNRDLSTMKIDLETTCELIDKVPDDMPVIAASGYDIGNPKHMAELRELMVDGVLIGTSLMRQDNPAAALASWLKSGQSS